MDKAQVLMDLCREEWSQRRHYREMRSKMAATLLTIVGIVVAVMTMDKSLDRFDRLPGLLLSALGIFGAVFSKFKHDRYDLHMSRANQLLEELDKEMGASFCEILKRGTTQFTATRRWSTWMRLDVMYYILYLGVAFVGAAIALTTG
jgi:C4-dicarboxylate-specific signal transduction histidine kinase